MYTYAGFFFNLKIFLKCFWPCLAVYRILVPRPGIEPVPLAVEVLEF